MKKPAHYRPVFCICGAAAARVGGELIPARVNVPRYRKSPRD